ncbi:MAG: replication initiator protein A, partial [Ruminococcus sp.]|nr:replication initiator protein A [Ruminococcus sp.]
MVYMYTDSTSVRSPVFYVLPKFLLDDEFKSLHNDAKLLYAFMLDRARLSAVRGLTGKDGRVFIYFSLEDAIEMLNIGHTKGTSIFRELEECGLIEREKGFNSTKIYVRSVETALKAVENDYDADLEQTSEVPEIGSPAAEKRNPECRNPTDNHNKSNNTD